MKESLLNIRQLRYFAKVVETGSITRAAEQLYIAQPALSLSIRQLEETVGVPLLQRHSRGVDATPAGELLYSRTCALFGYMEQMRTDVSRFGQQPRQLLNLGMPSSLVMLIGTEAIVIGREQLPNASVCLREDPSFVLVDAVENKEIDIAFAYSVAERPGIHLTPVLREELLLVTRADQAPKEEIVTLEQALDRDMATGGKRDAGRCIMEHAAGERGLPCEIMYEMQSIAGLREIMLRGMAASVLPYGSVAREVASGKLAIRRIDDPLMTQTMYIVRSARTPGSASFDEPSVMPYLSDLIDMIVDRQDGLARRIDARAPMAGYI